MTTLLQHFCVFVGIVHGTRFRLQAAAHAVINAGANGSDGLNQLIRGAEVVAFGVLGIGAPVWENSGCICPFLGTAVRAV